MDWGVESEINFLHLCLISVINCGFPGYLENGEVTGSSYLFGDSVWFTCDNGKRERERDRKIMIDTGIDDR